MSTFLIVIQITAIMFGLMLSINATAFGNGFLMLVGSILCALGITGLLYSLGVFA